MATCRLCGNPVQFVDIDGRATPLHVSGRCSGAGGKAVEGRKVASPDSSCIRTHCPQCRDPVFFIRYNGGSVFIDPPLGPPWSRHGCMLAPTRKDHADSAPAVAIATADVLQRLGRRPGLITGVVTEADVATRRMKTTLSMAVAETKPLKLLVRGGADYLLGKLVIVDTKNRIVFSIDDAEHSFGVLWAVEIPAALRSGTLSSLQKPATQSAHSAALPGSTARAVHTADGLAALMAHFRLHGLGSEWKLKDIWNLIDCLSGREKDRAIHAAGLWIMERSEKNGDVRAALELTLKASTLNRAQLVTWFRKYSPIIVDWKMNPPNVHLVKKIDGKRPEFQHKAARANPFFGG